MSNGKKEYFKRADERFINPDEKKKSFIEQCEEVDHMATPNEATEKFKERMKDLNGYRFSGVEEVDHMATPNEGLRYNEGKPRYSLIHYGSLEPLVRVMEYGAEKYAVDNWKKGMDQREVLDSLSRHLFKLIDGQEIDEESGIHHIGHIMANAMIYSYYIKKD